ncbi:MAG: lytic transglycosylase domain-containing protein [Bacteroidetes bacterium]|nr:lytic transglycosylase domain-containing protein [Bacteroidota bacterium]
MLKAVNFYLVIVITFLSLHVQANADFHKEDKAPRIMSSVPKAHLNKHGKQFVKNYLKTSGDDLNNVKSKSDIPFNIIDSIFRIQGLPLELKYLAVVESELKSSARSRVGAVGPWQLMPATAKILGLKVSKKVDERKNYYKSTRAAARYLKDLYQEFGDWFLVLAAYNGGPGPVYAAMRKSGSHNFWSLQAYLPRESRDHVKKFIATRYFFEGTKKAPALNNTAVRSNVNTENNLAVNN